MLGIAYKFGLGVSLCLAMASTEPAYAGSINGIRVAQSGGDFHQSVTLNCLAALTESAFRQGLEVEVIDPYDKHFEVRKDATADVAILPDVVLDFLVAKPDGFDVISDTAAFAGPAHFAKFLASDYYRTAIGSVEYGLTQGKIAGYAYGSTAQIFTPDAPILSPGDLHGRTMIGSFRAWWYADLVEELGIGHDPILGHTDNVIDDQRAAIIEAVARHRRDGYFILMPTIMAQAVVPSEFRQYVSLTMSHTMAVNFEVNNWFTLDAEGQEIVQSVVNEASSSCSERNFAEEKRVLDVLATEGTVVPVDIEPFLALARDKLEKDRAEAQEKNDDVLKRINAEQEAVFNSIQALR